MTERSFFLSPNEHFSSNGNVAEQFVDIIVFGGDAARRPVLIFIDRDVIIRPGPVQTYLPSYLGVGGNEALGLPFIEFFVVLFRGIIQRKEFIPFLVLFLSDN